MLPFALCSGILFKLDEQTLRFALISSVVAGLGDLGLMLAYKYSDISLAYPMARALPVFLTMAGCVIFDWGKSLGTLAITGMLIIFAGCMLILTGQRPAAPRRRPATRHPAWAPRRCAGR